MSWLSNQWFTGENIDLVVKGNNVYNSTSRLQQRFEYCGEVNENDEPCGHGTANTSGKYPDSRKEEFKYEGTFLNGELHGIGMSLGMRPYIYFI